MTPPKAPRFDYLQQAEPAEQAQASEQVEQVVSVELSRQEKQEVLAVIENQATPLQAARAALSNPEAFALPPQRRGRPPADGHTAPLRTEQPREQMNVRIRPELKRAAAMLASGQGLSLGDVVEAALIKYLKEHGEG